MATEVVINPVHVMRGSARPTRDIWNTVHGAVAGNVWGNNLRAEQHHVTAGDEYYLYRGFAQWDTSVIPASAKIVSAKLRFPTGLYVLSAGGTTATFYLLSGMPTYPSNPAVLSDFALSKYPNTVLSYTFTGLVYSSLLLAWEYKPAVSTDVFTLSTTAQLAYIATGVGAVTKFLLVTSADYNNTPPGHGPAGGSTTSIKGSESIDNDAPQLVVSYIIADQVVQTDPASGVV